MVWLSESEQFIFEVDYTFTDSNKEPVTASKIGRFPPRQRLLIYPGITIDGADVWQIVVNLDRFDWLKPFLARNDKLSVEIDLKI